MASTTKQNHPSAAQLHQAQERVRDLESQMRAIEQETAALAEADRTELAELNRRRPAGHQLRSLLANPPVVSHRGEQLVNSDREPIDLKRLKETTPGLWRFYRTWELRQARRRATQELEAARDKLRSAEAVASISLTPDQRATLQRVVDQAAAEKDLLDALYVGGTDPTGLYAAAPRKPGTLEGLLTAAAKLGVFPNGKRP